MIDTMYKGKKAVDDSRFATHLMSLSTVGGFLVGAGRYKFGLFHVSGLDILRESWDHIL